MGKLDRLTFTQTMEHQQGFRAVARVRSLDPVPLDEPEELGGEDSAPCPMDYLLTAVGGCLMSSLAMCLQKKRIADAGLAMDLTGDVARDEDGLLRVQRIHVRIRVRVPEEHRRKVEGCYGIFKKYCIVSASVARGIPLETELVFEE